MEHLVETKPWRRVGPPTRVTHGTNGVEDATNEDEDDDCRATSTPELRQPPQSRPPHDDVESSRDPPWHRAPPEPQSHPDECAGPDDRQQHHSGRSMAHRHRQRRVGTSNEHRDVGMVDPLQHGLGSHAPPATVVGSGITKEHESGESPHGQGESITPVVGRDHEPEPAKHHDRHHDGVDPAAPQWLPAGGRRALRSLPGLRSGLGHCCIVLRGCLAASDHVGSVLSWCRLPTYRSVTCV